MPAPQEGQAIVWAHNKLVLWPTGIYDPKTDSWETLGNQISTETRLSPQIAAIGSKLFVFGGYSERGGSQPLNTGGIYDLITKSWKKLNPKNAPTLREYTRTPRLFSVDGKVVLIDAGSESNVKILILQKIFRND